MADWQLVLLEPAKTVVAQVSNFLINVLLVLIILLIGWMLSNLIKTLVTKLLKTVRLDDLAEKVELNQLLAKGGITATLSELIGVIFYWLALLVTSVVAINAIGLTIAADLLNKVILYIPNIVAAIFILILSMFVATVLKNIVLTAATNAGLSQAKLLSRAVELIVIIFAVMIALDQLNINAKILEDAIRIVLAATGLALALSFGLGCKEIAGKATAEFIEKLKKK